MLRSVIIGRLGKAGDKEVVAEAKVRFAKHCKGAELLPADLRNAVSVVIVSSCFMLLMA